MTLRFCKVQRVLAATPPERQICLAAKDRPVYAACL